ncbi:MAG: hypothetical protein ABSF29_04875 [Tepidisphaeraceae bacterium]|jgi:hypothetical protein
MNFSKGALAASAVFAMCCFAAGARGQTSPVSVELAAPTCQTSLYDPRMPSRQMPTPQANEAGVTVSEFICKATATGRTYMQFHSGPDVVVGVHVESVRIALGLNVNEWVEYSAGAKVFSHEDGHALIAEHFYSRSDQIAQAIGQHLIGTDFFGSGPDAEAAANDALNVAAREVTQQYMGRVRNPSELVQNLYDRITAHGVNPIEEVDAIEMALHEMGKL